MAAAACMDGGNNLAVAGARHQPPLSLSFPRATWGQAGPLGLLLLVQLPLLSASCSLKRQMLPVLGNTALCKLFPPTLMFSVCV